MIFDTVTNKLFKNLLDGTVAAGNAKKLNGLTDKEVGESGTRNLIPYPYYQTTKNVNGIDFTDLGDGRIHAKGTATASASFVIRATAENWTVQSGIYTISGCPNGGSFSTYRLQIARFVDGTLTSYTNEYGTGATAEITDGLPILLQIVVASGVTIDATFEPMLEKGSVKHSFVPYFFGGAERALKADTINGFSIYTDITQLGITSYYIPDIVKAMPAKSMFVADIVSNKAYASVSENKLPIGNGELEIVRPVSNAGRTRVTFISGTNAYKNNMYFCDLDENNWVINKWYKFSDGGNATTVDGYDSTTLFKSIAVNLTSADDLETLLETGLYYYPSNNIPQNAPFQNASFVFIYKYNNNRTVQRVMRAGVVGQSKERMYVDSWKDWVEDINASNSAKVVISATAPTDTNALWVW